VTSVRKPPDSSAALEGLARESIEHFFRLLLQCGFTKTYIARQLADLESTGHSLAPPSAQIERSEPPEASHLITLWCSSPDFVDDNGQPLPLPARGKHRSVQSLLHRVNPNASVEEIIDYLRHTGTLRRLGGKYALNRRWLFIRGIPGSAQLRSLRELVGMLQTLEHNLTAPSHESGWFEFVAFNPHFPVSQLPGFDQYLRREGMGLLRKIDHFLHQREAARKAREPTVWVGVSLHHVQQASPRNGGPAAARPSAARGRRPKRARTRRAR
jgi:hypothetical protein